ncbi:unnamed protein product [Paramecium pentaurelia]|uniref:Uncharacterized protein n=1 Tax=Paramecium pentaurelia TaxID=43138 RepID=A0A8S1U8T2_9CILI|nr:unnamed protein product [Paramecium pentaurelia]
MNAIIYPIMPSITKIEGFIVSYNNTKQLIAVSLKELQLNFRKEKAVQLLEQQKQQIQQFQEIKQDPQQGQCYQQQQNSQQPLFLDNTQNVHQILGQQNFQICQANCYNICYNQINYEQKYQEDIENKENYSTCSTPKFDDIGNDFQMEPNYIKIQTSKKKNSHQKGIFFTFQKEEAYEFKQKIKRESLQQIYSNQKKGIQFTISIPKNNLSFQTDFYSLGFKKLKEQTIQDLLKKILNYYSQSVKIYQCNDKLGMKMQLQNQQLLRELVVLDGTEFRIIDIASDQVQGIDQVKFEYGEVEFHHQDNVNYLQLCKFSQDCVEIHDSILKDVERITFYNFGESSQKAKTLKLQDFNEFVKWVKCWCVQNNFDIIHIGTHLTVRLI